MCERICLRPSAGADFAHFEGPAQFIGSLSSGSGVLPTSGQTRTITIRELAAAKSLDPAGLIKTSDPGEKLRCSSAGV